MEEDHTPTRLIGRFDFNEDTKREKWEGEEEDVRASEREIAG